ncbi:MAG: hypothetical protein K2X99_01660, partial [Gemmatimonadaceae bacterium]|nr:hypothetical protein [Gemmatimonadaceae bacterium]
MSIALLRQQLSAVIDGGRPESPGFPTGLEALDALLPGGGFPRGRLTEVASALGHGRTTFLRQCVTHALARGSWVAVIDATRTLAARDWAAVHTEVDGLWMVRPKDPARGAWCADVLLRSGAFGLVILDGAPPLARAAGVR